MTSDRAFWDSSALVPLCIEQQAKPEISAWSRQFRQVVWWGTVVEVQSAVARLFRLGQIGDDDKFAGQIRLAGLMEAWEEVLPTTELRDLAADLLYAYPLRAADTLQLAAAMIWCRQKPSGRTFITGDVSLAKAVANIGFSVLTPKILS